MKILNQFSGFAKTLVLFFITFLPIIIFAQTPDTPTPDCFADNLSWLESVWCLLKQSVNPKTIIRVGGLWLLIAVVFAETGLLAGFFLPGDSLLFTAGLLCADHNLHSDSFFGFNILSVLIFVTLAAVLGDSFGYFIGKTTGHKVFNRPKSLLFKPEYVTTTRKFYDKYGDKALILGRFLPVIRTFAPVMAGVVHLHYPRFLSYNVIGGVLWVFSLSLTGYFLGTQFPWIQNYYEHIVLGLIIVTTIPIIRMIIKEAKQNKVNPPNNEDMTPKR
jgi:membrane-associated protein